MPAHELDLKPHISDIPRLLDWVEACCGADVADEVRFNMTLVLEEAVTNVIKHAFEGLASPHVIRVSLDITPQAVAATVTDNGRPFDPTKAADPDVSLPLEDRVPGGLGIHLMRNMTDGFSYRRDDGNNILRLEKARG